MALHLIKKPLPKLRSERLCVRLLEPHESAKMVQFRLDNREHLEEWEPRRSPEFFTEGFWQIQLRISLRDFRDGATVNFVLLDAAEEGDLICVAPGNYSQNITFPANIC